MSGPQGPATGACLVLTGGLSTRMGRPKALLPFRGGTFLGVILERLAPLGLWTAVVKAPGLAVAGPRVLVNPRPESGPIGSIQVGLAAGAENFPWVLTVPVDHPAVAEETYRALARAASEGGAHLWAPTFRGRRGHPVVFGAECFEDLRRVPEGEGARWVVARHREHRAEVPVEDPEILRNVDTPEDHLRLIEEYGP